jgi:hypothetical protein
MNVSEFFGNRDIMQAIVITARGLALAVRQLPWNSTNWA